jgi:MYXO-CTERM domain-containing protein
MRARPLSVSRRLLTTLLVAAPAAFGLASHAGANVPSNAPSAALATSPVRRPLLLTGALATASTRDAETIAREVMTTQLAWARGLEFQHDKTFEPGDGSRIVVLTQTIDGVPVLGRGARVVVEADGRATAVTSALEEQRPRTTVASLSTTLAFEVAARAMKGLVTEHAPVALVVAPSFDGEPRLAYLVHGGVPGLPLRPSALIDARTGEVIGVWDRAVYERQAKVYEFNPVKTPTLTTTSMTNTNATTVAGLDNDRVTSRNCIDKKTVKALNFGGFMINAHVCDLLPTVTANASGDYTDIAPDTTGKAPEDTYAELSMFYHTDKAYKHAKDLGLVATSKLTAVGNLRVPDGYQTQDPVKLANPDLPLLPFDNAFFAPNDPTFSLIFGLTGDAMWFGQGTFIDFGYDGDVVYHEFGHFVVDQTAKLVGDPHLDEFGSSVSPGALNEGLADIYSFFITGDSATGEYASKGLTKDPSIRDAANKETMPDALIGEVHQDSNPFSAAVWAAYSPLDATKRLAFQKAWLKGMMMVPSGNLGYGDFADVEVAAITANVDAATGDALKQAFDARGVKLDGRVRTYAGTPIKSFVPEQGLYALGTNSFQTGAPKLVPGIFQVKYDAPAGGNVTLHASFKIFPSQGGGNPLSGAPPKFVPVVLAKPGGDPIKFAAKAASHDATQAPCTVTASSATCDVTVNVAGAAGTTAPVHLMIANTGGSANIDSLTLTNDPVIPDAPVDADAGAETGNGDQPAAAASSSGCGCEVPGDAAPSNGGLALLGASALAGLVLARRRR